MVTKTIRKEGSMGTIETLSKMFFIIDSSGNYYRLDSDDQLVVADGK